MKSKTILSFAILFAMGMVSLAVGDAAVTHNPERLWIKASNRLGFALEEMQVVVRDLEAEQYDNANRSYKRATTYFSKALKNLEKANLNEEQQKALEEFEERFDALDPEAESLTQSKATALLELFGETHDSFKISG